MKDEATIRERYRIAKDPGWQVQVRRDANDGEDRSAWVAVSFSGSEEAAKRSLERHIQRAIEWAKLTPDERMAAILRAEQGTR